MWPTSINARCRFSLLACALLALGCGSREAASNEPLTLIVSGDTAGWIVPCGCTSNQSGGLLRRGTFVKSSAGATMVVDAGGAASGASPYDQEKFKAIIAGERAMGVVAHNLGASEARLGVGFLRQLAADSPVPLVSCNVRDTTGALLVKPWLVHAAGGQRVLIIGALSDQTRIAGVDVAPPRPAIAAALTEAQGKFDRVVVLAYFPEDELLQLAENLPEVDAIIGGPTGQSVAPRLVGPTMVASATNKGKFLAKLDVPAKGSTETWRGEIVEMSAEIAEDAQQRENLQQFYAVLAEKDFTPQQTSFAPALPPGAPDDFRLAGTRTCQDCHEAEHKAWQQSGHAHAWQSLEKTRSHVDAYCQQCHTTGYGLPGGFESVARSSGMTSVGCESCHGPSAAHAREPSVATAYGGQSANQCTRCHDRENSPAFAYEAYWPRIRHGEKPAPAVNP
jgi:hypothetical protein